MGVEDVSAYISKRGGLTRYEGRDGDTGCMRVVRCGMGGMVPWQGGRAQQEACIACESTVEVRRCGQVWVDWRSGGQVPRCSLPQSLDRRQP